MRKSAARRGRRAVPHQWCRRSPRLATSSTAHAGSQGGWRRASRYAEMLAGKKGPSELRCDSRRCDLHLAGGGERRAHRRAGEKAKGQATRSASFRSPGERPGESDGMNQDGLVKIQACRREDRPCARRSYPRAPRVFDLIAEAVTILNIHGCCRGHRPHGPRPPDADRNRGRGRPRRGWSRDPQLITQSWIGMNPVVRCSLTNPAGVW